MERADGNRKLWLLKNTSDHHRPECLAAAIALGILAGLVPKLNLLAAILYGLILVLPVHTFLAVAISVAVALLSFQLDAAAHAIGQSLLSQNSLRTLWSSLERAPLVPWMSLHNTVVLGHLVIGTLLFAPVYLISLRMFERLAYGNRTQRAAQRPSIESYAPVPVEEVEPLTTKREPYRQRDSAPDRRRTELPQPQESSVDRSPLIIPPPKLQRATARAMDDSLPSAPDEPVLFEPIDHTPIDHASNAHKPQTNVNGWHMQHAMGETQLANARPDRQSHSQSAKPDSVKSNAVKASTVKMDSAGGPEGAKRQSDAFYPQMTEAAAVVRDQSTTNALPPAPIRPEGTLNSLQVAQSASEVLSWVDDLLDECLAEEGMTIVTQDVEASSNPTFANSAYANSTFDRQTIDDADMSSVNDRGNGPRWLLETTVEIVRLTDETMSDQLMATEQSLDCPAQPEQPEPQAMENSRVMPTESMTRAWPRVGGSGAAGHALGNAALTHEAGEPTILNLNQATGRLPADNRTGFQQLVMAGVSKDTEERSSLPIEPVKGECLAYLLGHLRQSREGKSS